MIYVIGFRSSWIERVYGRGLGRAAMTGLWSFASYLHTSYTKNWSNWFVLFLQFIHRSSRCKSVGRCVCEWQTATRLREEAHCRTGADGRTTVRYFATTFSFTWWVFQYHNKLDTTAFCDSFQGRRISAFKTHDTNNIYSLFVFLYLHWQAAYRKSWHDSMKLVLYVRVRLVAAKPR